MDKKKYGTTPASQNIFIYLFVKGQAGMVEEEEEDDTEQMDAHMSGSVEMTEGDQEEGDEDMDEEPHVNGS